MHVFIPLPAYRLPLPSTSIRPWMHGQPPLGLCCAAAGAGAGVTTWARDEWAAFSAEADPFLVDGCEREGRYVCSRPARQSPATTPHHPARAFLLRVPASQPLRRQQVQ